MRHRAPRHPVALLRRRWSRPLRRTPGGDLTHPDSRLAGAVASLLALVLAGVLVGVGQLGVGDVPMGAERTYTDRSETEEPSRSSDRAPRPNSHASETPSVAPAPEPEPAAASPAVTRDRPAEQPAPTTRVQEPKANRTPSLLDLPSAQVQAGGLSTTAQTLPTQDDRSTALQADGDPPQTTILSGPSPTDGPGVEEQSRFVFDSDEAATFQCSLDDQPYQPCDSPQEYTGLEAGPHGFAVRAVDEAGNVDPTPDEHRWVTAGFPQ